MSIKEHLKDVARSFFIVVTLINIALTVLGSFFRPVRQLEYSMFGYPILYGLCSMIPILVMYSPKELTIRQLLVRKLIQMISITVLLVLLIFGIDGVCAENAGSILGVSASVVAVYVLEEVISWLINTRNAQNLTESLRRYQEKRLNQRQDPQ